MLSNNTHWLQFFSLQFPVPQGLLHLPSDDHCPNIGARKKKQKIFEPILLHTTQLY